MFIFSFLFSSPQLEACAARVSLAYSLEQIGHVPNVCLAELQNNHNKMKISIISLYSINCPKELHK